MQIKENYTINLNRVRKVWICLGKITGFKPSVAVTEGKLETANVLNPFYKQV